MNKSKNNVGENKSRADESWYADRKDKKDTPKNVTPGKDISSGDKGSKRM